MSNQPIINLPRTKSDQILDIMAAFLLVLFWGFSMYYYRYLPEEIPIHFDIKGEVDNYANRKTIFLLPIIGTLLVGFLTLLGRNPETFNYSVKITLENAERQYSNAILMLKVMRLIIIFVFLLIDWEIIQIGLGNSEGLGVWFLPIFLTIVFTPIIYFVIRAMKLK